MRLSNPAALDLSTILRAPLDRLDAAPQWVKAIAVAGGCWQYALAFVQRDLFRGALLLVLVTGALDYLFGVRAAKLEKPPTYDPRIAHKGAMGKLTGVALLLLVRLFEAWAGSFHVIDTKGFLATALAVSLFAVDLQSIAHHRESYGAAPIPVLSKLLGFLQQWASSQIPPSAGGGAA